MAATKFGLREDLYYWPDFCYRGDSHIGNSDFEQQTKSCQEFFARLLAGDFPIAYVVLRMFLADSGRYVASVGLDPR